MKRWPHRGGQRRRDLELTTDWLIAFQTQTSRARIAPGSPGWNTQVDALLDRFEEAFGSRARVARLFARIRDHATTIAADVPIVLKHMDLGPWNVLVDGDRVNVIDWEVARDGLVLSDAIYAAVHWSFASTGRTSEPARRDHLRWLLADSSDEDPDRSSVHAAIRRCCAAIDLDPRLIRALVVLTFVDQALDRSSRLQLIGTPDRDPWTQNRYVGYVDEIATFDDGWISGAWLEQVSVARRTPLRDSRSSKERR
jgi:Ser/Thr protein kinase RdoA (MazF antagonist)